MPVMDDDDDHSVAADYDDSNRAFMQAFLARGTMDLKEGKKALAAIFTAKEGKQNDAEDVTEADFQSYLSAAQSALSPFDYEIRNAEHQVSKTRIWALVNSTSDPLTQLATTRSAREIAYVKRLLDAMFEKYNTPRQEIMGVTSLQAVNLAKGSSGGGRQSGAGQGTQGTDTDLKKDEAEALLASLVGEGWLERSKEGWYTLSPRALMELRGWLVETYNDPDAEADEWQRIKNCVACRNIITVGQRCANLDCTVRLHDICQAAFWRTREETKCPRCNTNWVARHWVGEKAITTTEAYLKGKRRSSGPRRNEVLEDEDDE